MSTTQASDAHRNGRRPEQTIEATDNHADESSLRQDHDEFAGCACRGDGGSDGLAPPCDDLGHLAYFAEKAAKRNQALVYVADFVIQKSGLGYLSDSEGLAIAAHTRRGLTRRSGGLP